jgi:hypothetical protein
MRRLEANVPVSNSSFLFFSFLLPFSLSLSLALSLSLSFSSSEQSALSSPAPLSMSYERIFSSFVLSLAHTAHTMATPLPFIEVYTVAATFGSFHSFRMLRAALPLAINQLPECETVAVATHEISPQQRGAWSQAAFGTEPSLCDMFGNEEFPTPRTPSSAASGTARSIDGGPSGRAHGHGLPRCAWHIDASVPPEVLLAEPVQWARLLLLPPAALQVEVRPSHSVTFWGAGCRSMGGLCV